MLFKIHLKLVTIVLFSLSTQAYAVTDDQYEPDGSLADAKLINAGEIQSHSMPPQDRDDWLKFIITEHDNIEFNISSDQQRDPCMVFYDSNHIPFDSSGCRNYFRLRALKPSIYYVDLMHSGQEEIQYSIEFKTSSSNGDSYESDNISADANNIYPGIQQIHGRIPLNDIDWVKFTLTEKDDIQIRTADSGSASHTKLLYNSELTRIYGTNRDTLIVNNLESGLYYASIHGNDNNEVSEYSLELIANSVKQPSFLVTPILNLLLLDQELN